jgi:hypothetical protein
MMIIKSVYPVLYLSAATSPGFPNLSTTDILIKIIFFSLVPELKSSLAHARQVLYILHPFPAHKIIFLLGNGGLLYAF